jgi:hypothetical protein
MASPDHNRSLAALLDLLIPGDARWPSASGAGVTRAEIARDADAETLAWIDAQSDATVADLAALERAEPQRFRRMLEAVYRAYYTTPAAQAIVVALANAGPREPSPYFDESLVAKVIATQAGRRRL